jgi:nucleotide-binding universal stress UspA family protein
MTSKIPLLLLCLDLEEGSEALARYAANVAGRCEQKIHIFYVEPAGRTSVIKDARSCLERLAAKTIPERNLEEIAIRQGIAEDEIIAYAGQHDFDPIILGRRQRSAVERIYVGSTTSAVLSLTSSPVLVVPLSAEGIH